MAATYARAVQKIGRNHTKMSLVQRIFKWIACAKRPLLMEELAEAIAFKPSDLSWDEAKIPDASRLIRACGNLLVLDDDGTARFVHHTVQQFLTGLPPGGSIPEFHFAMSKADAEAGEICITYLSFSDFERQVTISRPNNPQENNLLSPINIVGSAMSGIGITYVISGALKLWGHLRLRNAEPRLLALGFAKLVELKKPPPPDLSRKYQFLNYALENWLMHASMITEDDRSWNRFKHLALDKHTSFDIRPWGNPDASNPLPYMGLFRWAIDAGHVGLLKLLSQLPTGPTLHAYYRQVSEQGHDVTANASIHGHANMIIFLVNQNCIDPKDGKPLLSLAAIGNISAVRLLLELGLCVGAKIEALLIAARSGHTAVMGVLLENEPPLDLQAGWGKSVLTVAASSYSDEILVLLLGKAANFELAKLELERFWAADTLLKAAERGMDGMVNMLLAKTGVDPNFKDNEGWTPLQWAAENGHEAIIKLLLAKGADPNSKDNIGWTPLQWAEIKGDEAILKLLRLHMDNASK